MSHSVYPMTREPHPPYRESGLTKVLALLLLIVAGALVLGAIPALIGLIVVMPVLGHATWHLYRRLVE